MNHYEVLGVSRTAPSSVVRAAYQALLREHHPDRVGAVGVEVTQRLNEARAVLLDPERRAAYDAALEKSERRPEPAPERAPDPGWGVEEEVAPAHFSAPYGRGFGTPAPSPGWQPPPPPTFGPGATPLTAPVTPQRWAAPTPVAVSRPVPLWGATWWQRITGVVWLLLTLVGPVATLAYATDGAGSGVAFSLAIYAALIWFSFSGGRKRIRRGSVSKRYILSCLGALALCLVAGYTAVYLGAWLVTYVLAVESRRQWKGAS